MLTSAEVSCLVFSMLSEIAYVTQAMPPMKQNTRNVFAGQYPEWVKDPHAIDRSCCSLTGQTQTLVLAQPGHQASGVSVADAAQPTPAPEPSPAPSPPAVKPSFLFSSAKALDGLILSRAHREGVCAQGADNAHPSARGSPGVLMRPASSHRNTLCSFVTRVQAITGCSERANTKARLQKVPCVNCPRCYSSSVKNRCVSAINC